MTIEQARDLQASLFEVECVDIEIHEDYSGRGMYGSTTTAVVYRVEDGEDVEAAARRLDIELTRDNMGLGLCAY